jgi:hypothetical protein
MHPRKSAEGGIEDSISGSAAFRNVSRGVLNVYRDPTDADWRLLMTSKSNYLAERPATLRFRIEPWEKDPAEGRVVWPTAEQGLHDQRSAEDIWRELQEKNRQHRRRTDKAVEEAEKFLTATLSPAGRVVPIPEIREAANKAAVVWRNVEKAKASLGVDSKKAKPDPSKPPVVVGWCLPPQDTEGEI